METLQEKAFEYLKDMIINHELSYHEIYSETQIANQIGISRTPLRDAIHRLKQEGLIETIPSKGFRLHQLTKKDVIETFQIRSAIECYCTLEITKQYQSQRAAGLFEQLEKALAEMQRIIDSTHSIQEFCKYDFQFHTLIIEYMQNEQFTYTFNTFMYRMQKLAATSLMHKGRMEQTYREHLDIFTAMRSGDTGHVYQITLTHMDTPKHINLEDIDTLMKEVPGDKG